MILTIPYIRLKAYMQNDLKYTSKEAAHAISRLRKAGAEVQKGFSAYWKTGVIPQTPINGIRIDKLMELRGMDIVAAFLAADSLKRKPQGTKWFLTHPVDIRRTTPEDLELLEKLARDNHWDLDKDVPIEDTSDLSFGETEPK